MKLPIFFPVVSPEILLITIMSKNEKIANGYDKDGYRQGSLYLEDVDHTAPLVTTPRSKDDFLEKPKWTPATESSVSPMVNGHERKDQVESSAPSTMGARIKSTMRINPKLLPAKLLVFLIYGGNFEIFSRFVRSC